GAQKLRHQILLDLGGDEVAARLALHRDGAVEVGIEAHAEEAVVLFAEDAELDGDRLADPHLADVVDAGERDAGELRLGAVHAAAHQEIAEELAALHAHDLLEAAPLSLALDAGEREQR